MFKQWLSRRRSYSSTDWSTAATATPPHRKRHHQHHVTSPDRHHHQHHNHLPLQPQSFPLADKYLVSRINPIYVDENHQPHHHYFDLQPPPEVDHDDGPDHNYEPPPPPPPFIGGYHHHHHLPASTKWCPHSCPHHYPGTTTPCVQPVWFHCDTCSGRPISCEHNQCSKIKCPEVVPYHVSASTYGLEQQWSTTNNNHVNARHHHINHQQQQHRHLLCSKECCARNVVANYYVMPEDMITARNRIGSTVTTPVIYHVIGGETPSVSETFLSRLESVIVPDSLDVSTVVSTRLNTTESVGSSGTRASPFLQIYVNPDFVSGIAVRGNTGHFHDRLQQLGGVERLEQVIISPEHGGRHLRNNSAIPAAHPQQNDADSLESLRIDEGMFAPSPPHHLTSSVEVVTRRSDPVGTITPANFDTLSSDARSVVVTYDAIKDLYEKLSNSKQRHALTHAMSGSSQRSHQSPFIGGGSSVSLPTNTYETLGRHTINGAYAKLTYSTTSEPTTSTISPVSGSGVYLVPNATSSAAGDLRPPLESPPPVPGTSGGGRATTNGAGRPLPDITYDVSPAPGNDQFMTRRDPSYGPQVTEVRNLIPGRNQPQTLFQRINKRFRQKNYRDACKIIATTVVGLTAFGIITALSLGINRQPG